MDAESPRLNALHRSRFSDTRVPGHESNAVRQTRSSNNLICRVGTKFQGRQVKAHLASDGPNMHAVQSCRKRFIVETMAKPAADSAWLSAKAQSPRYSTQDRW
jgi:hypothetical protein